MSAPILVTGHSGFIGKALGRRLDAGGLAWSGVSGRAVASLADPDAAARLPEAEVIVHLAGRVGILGSWQDPAGTHRDNFLTTLAVMEHARRCRARIVLMSSYVYGPPQYLPVDEDHPLSAANPYGWSKLESELLARAYAQDFAIPVTALRLFGVYGPDQDDNQLVPTILRQALSGDTVSLADPRPKRDLLWVDDVADAVVAVIAAPPQPAGFTPYNLGSGTALSVAEVVDAALGLTGPRKVVWRNERRPNEVLECVADCARFRRDFAWAPRTDLTEGLRHMLAAMERKPCS